MNLDEDEVIAVLRRLQQFDPAGVFARDLRECLLLQLQQLPADTQWLSETKEIIRDHIELLGSKDYKA